MLKARSKGLQSSNCDVPALLGLLRMEGASSASFSRCLRGQRGAYLLTCISMNTRTFQKGEQQA